ncbi:ABC transporter permease [Citricoccus sp. SGAir0253]|nr:ABC transporter permease [Citricoccus sp. SGAir0253]
MYLSLRDVRSSAGRFSLLGAVVALVTLLLVFLTALTGGLAEQNVSAVRAWEDAGAGSDVTVAFGAAHATDPADVEASFTASSVDAAQLTAWRRDGQVSWAEPVGITQARADSGAAAAALTLVGLEPGSRLAPEGAGPVLRTEALPAGRAAADAAGTAGADGTAGTAGTVVLSESAAADLGAAPGDRLEVNGRALAVGGTVPDAWYSHTPVAWLPLEAWTAVSRSPADTATVLVAGTDPAAGHRPAAAQGTATVATDVAGALAALPSYSSENGSLVLMQGFLYGISSLVIAAFMAVITLQRTPDIAVLKALGATTGWVVRDALAQAAIVLLGGAVVGAGLGTAGLLLARGAVPVQLDAAAVAVPVLATLALGLAAAAAAVWRTCRVDPLVALGGS